MSAPAGSRSIPITNLGSASVSSPLPLAPEGVSGRRRFIADGIWVRHQIEIPPEDPNEEDLWFERAGPRERLFFPPAQTRAAVVTCGGLCPGLNNVIRSLFLEMHYRYGVAEILGIRNGYQGLNPKVGLSPLRLTRECVADIHTEGGTLIGTSRGPQDPAVMVDFLEQQKINILFCVGGDGTQRGAHTITEEIARRKAKISVIGIPKTIDNDVAYCDRTFGFVTAVEKAREVLDSAHTEATGAWRGVGLVKLMGREAGFIAAGATIVSQEVNFALIPESPFYLDGELGLLAALDRRMEARGHAVIVVAEGAGQHLLPPSPGVDASGNQRLQDIGLFLKQRIGDYFREIGRPVDIKYIDPSYIVRSVPANVDDAFLCDLLARNAVHAAMAGKTDMIVGYSHGRFIHIPISMVVQRKRQIDVRGEIWAAVLAATGQPSGWGPA